MCWKNDILWFALAGFVAIGCSGDNSGPKCDGEIINGLCYGSNTRTVIGEPCSAHVECKGQAACIQGECQQECTENWQCPQPGECVGFQCISGSAPDVTSPPTDTAGPTDTASPPAPDTTTGAPCNSNFDCQGEGACINGHCGKECDSDSDCPSGGSCLQFQCVGGDPPDAGSPVDTASPPDTASPVDTAEPLPAGCEGKKGPYGAPCKCKEDCATGLCVGDSEQGFGFCTQDCFTSSNCPGTDWCLDVGGGTKVCVKNDAGAACINGCLSTQLVNQQGLCVCTVPCSTSAECPANMACSQVPGASSKVCVPIGDLCASQPLMCFGKCFPDLSNTLLCTAICSSINDCPAGWTCHQEVLNGQVEQNCLPN